MSLFGDFFKNIKDKAVQKLVERQMKDLPPEQQQMVMAIVQENPKLFEKIAKEVEAMKKTGVNEMYASMIVMKKYQREMVEITSKHRKIERQIIKK